MSDETKTNDQATAQAVDLNTLVRALKIAMDSWQSCYVAYDVQMDGMTAEKSCQNLEKDRDWQAVKLILNKLLP